MGPSVKAGILHAGKWISLDRRFAEEIKEMLRDWHATRSAGLQGLEEFNTRLAAAASVFLAMMNNAIW